MTNVVPVQMPKLTMAAIEGIFIQWLVADGEHVDEEQPLYLVGTDKVETEVLSPATGVLRHGEAEPDAVYPIGTQLAVIDVDAAPATDLPALGPGAEDQQSRKEPTCQPPPRTTWSCSVRERPG